MGICINANNSNIVLFFKVYKEKVERVKMFRMEKAKKNWSIQQYKYLHLLLDQHLKFEPYDNVLAKSGGSALAVLLTNYNFNTKLNSYIYRKWDSGKPTYSEMCNYNKVN